MSPAAIAAAERLHRNNQAEQDQAAQVNQGRPDLSRAAYPDPFGRRRGQAVPMEDVYYRRI